MLLQLGIHIHLKSSRDISFINDLFALTGDRYSDVESIQLIEYRLISLDHGLPDDGAIRIGNSNDEYNVLITGSNLLRIEHSKFERKCLIKNGELNGFGKIGRLIVDQKG